MKRLLVALLIFFLVLVVAAVALWRWSYGAPSWYNPPNAADEHVQVLADRFEYDLIEQSHKMRSAGERWSIRLSESQINTWLATRLPQWIAHHAEADWPETFGTPQVHILPGGISLALPLLEAFSSRTIVITVHPTLQDEKLRFQVKHLALGEIGLAGEPVVNLAEALAEASPDIADDPHLQEVLEALTGHALVDPALALSDGRIVLLRDIRLREGEIELVAQTREDFGR